MDSHKTPERAITLAEYGRRYSVSRSTIYKLIKSGQLKTATIGKKRLVPVDEAERFLREKTDQAMATDVKGHAAQSKAKRMKGIGKRTGHEEKRKWK